MRVVRPIVSTVGGVAVLVSLAGCGSDAPRSTEPTNDSDVARTVCDAIRGFDNGLVDATNESVAGIAALSPDERRTALDDGLTAVVAVVEQWRESIAGLQIPDVAEADQLRDQLASGADEALAELTDQATQAAGAGPVADDDVQGQVGIWFNSIEKVMSVSEPKIFVLERTELKQAFLDEPNCRNVIQMFVND
jgi:hypothetical protein